MSKSLRVFFIAGAAVLALQAASGPSNAAAPRYDSWSVIGPGGGGTMFYPTVSPHDVRDVLVRCDMTGAYITHDAGATWRMFNLRGTVSQFVFDPTDRKVIYATTGPLWRSEDAGRTWSLLFPDPASVHIEMTDDHAGARHVTADGRTPRVTALAVDPADSRILYAAITDRDGSTLRISRDRGLKWAIAAPLPDGGRRIWIDHESRRTDRTVYVAGRTSVMVRRGGTWKRGPAAPAAFSDVDGGFAKAGNLVVYGVSPSGIHVSEDGGASWRDTGVGGPARYVAAGAALHHGTTGYVSFENLQESGGRYFGVAKTIDSGRTWSIVWKDSDTQPASNVEGGWIADRFGPGWPGQPQYLGVAPDNPDICYGTDSGRTMRTTDGGRTWTQVYAKQMPGGGWTTTGLDVTTDYGIHFDPFDPKRWFITYTDIGLFRSEDGGASWISATTGVPRPWVNTTYWMEFDPEVKGRAWAVASGIHDLPRPKMWRRQAVSRYNGGVLVTDDGGKNWKVSGTMPQTAATHILVDPASPAKSRTLYVAAFGRGVFKSTNGGQTWELRNEGIAGPEPFAWRLSRTGDGTLYLVVARRSDDGSIGNAQDGALYRSTDGAAHWTKLSLPEGVNGPNALTIDPTDAKRLYLSVWRRSTNAPDGGGGIYLSSDAGASWKRVFAGDQHVYDVTIDPRNSTLYAAGFSSSAWRSTDRGTTWRRIPGYNFKWGHRVMPDPRSPDRIFITTFGGSVWWGPAAGDPQAVEDIVTKEVGYGR
ncbi:MAG TPA: hypothetical protein VN428_20365 [Bryobacteraceae bacterium]|nr:hypothetical protein [Bryobacteraceae bacterium]